MEVAEVMQKRTGYQVVTNSDLTEGKGHPVYREVCLSKTTATRLAHRKGVMGSDASVKEYPLLEIDGFWYGQVHPVHPSKEDAAHDKKMEEAQKLLQKALDAGLTKEDLQILASTYK